MQRKSITYISLGIICIISSLTLKGSLLNIMESIGNFASGFVQSIHNFINLLIESIAINGNNAIGLFIIVIVLIVLIIVSKEK